MELSLGRIFVRGKSRKDPQEGRGGEVANAPSQPSLFKYCNDRMH